MSRYIISVDFGTLSCRALVVELQTGRELADTVFSYPHGVMDFVLPSGQRLPANFALQHPQDYLDAVSCVFPSVVEKSGIQPRDVAGISLDFTTCTVLPVNEELYPLCLLPEWEQEPHAYVKLWKHHAAQEEADLITKVLRQYDAELLEAYGGAVSSEFFFPKVLETLKKAPRVYESAYRFLEAGDWIASLLTGEEIHSEGYAVAKALFHVKKGFPAKEFFAELDPRLADVIGNKVNKNTTPIARIAGRLNEKGASMTGLPVGIPVCTPMPDAHCAMPALGISSVGRMMLIVGTSIVIFANHDKEKLIPGMMGCQLSSALPDVFTYEGGQAGGGDILDWFVTHCVPQGYYDEAAERGIGIHALLREKAKRRKPGESGLLALDWLNGNRSVLSDTSLSGLMLGMKMTTRPEDMYRAWIESIVFGGRVIMDRLEEYGVRVDTVYTSGGIALKDDMMMQIYADVWNKEIAVAATKQGPALGNAISAAYAIGAYASIEEAAKHMASSIAKVYRPIDENVKRYAELYREYLRLYRYFGEGENNVMKIIK